MTDHHLVNTFCNYVKFHLNLPHWGPHCLRVPH